MYESAEVFARHDSPEIANPSAARTATGVCSSGLPEPRLNVVAGATDASRAILPTSCRKVELLTAIFGFR
jgi:hypothetical protein